MTSSLNLIIGGSHFGISYFLVVISLGWNAFVEVSVFKWDGVEALNELPDWKGDHDVGQEQVNGAISHSPSIIDAITFE